MKTLDSGNSRPLPDLAPSGRAPSHALRIRITLILVAVVLTIWAAVGFNILQERREANTAALRHTQNLVRVIEAQVHGQLDAVDVVLFAASSALPTMPGQAVARDPQVQALLKALLAKSDPLRALWVVNEHGDMVHDSDNRPGQFNYAHRSYFTQQRDNPGLGLYVGEPIVNDKGVWFVSLSRRVLKPDGSFGGVVVAALEPRYFEGIFAKLDIGQNGNLTLLTADFNLMSRYPVADAMRGQSLRGKTNLPSLVEKADEGTYQSRSSVDGQERIFAYRKAEKYPFVVVAGLGLDEALAGWWRTAWIAMAATLALSCLLTALGWRVLRELTTSRALHAALVQSKWRTEAALQEVEGLLVAIPDLLFVVDPEGRVLDYKGKRDDLLYVPEPVFLGKLVNEFLPTAAAQAVMQAVESAAKSGASSGYTYALDLPGGTKWFELSVARMGDPARGDTQFVLLTRDISERIEARAALEESNLQLKRSNTDLEQFAYAASHDLLEPLRSVAGSVQLLKKRYEGQLDERADTFIAHAVAGVKRMETLIADLLAYSRLSSGAEAMTEVPLGEVLTTACDNLQAAIADSAAQISHDDLPVIQGDAGQLSHLLQNLIANALKFRGDKAAVVHVGAKREAKQWVISVADQGIGIAPQHFERIFGIFKRLHTREEYAGNGIGLTLCQRIVERHGGRIWVESELGQGTTFFFSVPDKSV